MKKPELISLIKEEIAEIVASSNVDTRPSDVKRLEKSLSTAPVTAAAAAINDRNELRRSIPTITKKWGPSLQPDKINLSNILADIKIGLVAAGYK